MALLAPFPDNEQERLEAVHRTNILDTAPEQAFDDLALIASQICGTPISTVTLIDTHRQWFKATAGPVAVRESPREESFCAHTILGEDIFVVEDTATDTRFFDNPHVVNAPNIRFYAGAPLRSHDGFALGSLCVIDTQPRVLSAQQQATLRALGNQVEQLLELRRVGKELQRALRAKSDFLRIASHDLKNPLAVILGGVALVRDQIGTVVPATRELSIASDFCGRVLRQAKHMLRLIESYLDAQALDDGRLSLELTCTCLTEIAHDVMDDLRGVAEKKGSSIELQQDATANLTMCDPPRINQVITNFVSNALKFGPRGGEVRISIYQAQNLPESMVPAAAHQKPEQYVILKVQDTGPGLTKEDSTRLFSAYGKLSARPTGDESSSGLGLDISRRLIELHGGVVGVHNNQGGGATFWFALPA